jgi:hypothetical protein
MGLGALSIILVIMLFGILLALFRNTFPIVKTFIDNMVEGVNELKKFKKQKPF